MRRRSFSCNDALFLRRAHLAGDDRLVRLRLDKQSLADANLVSGNAVPLTKSIRCRVPASGDRGEGVASLDRVVLRLGGLLHREPALRLDGGTPFRLLGAQGNEAFVARRNRVKKQACFPPRLRRNAVSVTALGRIDDERLGNPEKSPPGPQLDHRVDLKVVLGEGGGTITRAQEVARLESKEEQPAICEDEQAARRTEVVDPGAL